MTKKQIIIISIAAIGILLLGLLIGFFIGRGGNSGSNAAHNHNHEVEGESVWTCPMHPQIQQNEEGTCPICGMDLVVLDQNNQGGEDSPLRLEMTQDAVRLSNIQTTIVGGGERPIGSEKQLGVTGKVKMDERKNSTQTAHIAGRIEKLFIQNYKGEQIRKGQKIMSIYSPQLVTAQKELLEAKKMKADFPKLYEAAKEKLRLWKLPEETIQKIESTEEILRELTIFSDVGGTLMKTYVEEGDHLREGSPLFDLMDLSRVWVLFDIYERDLQWVKVGDLVEFNLAGQPERTIKARITFIDPIINPQTRVATARVEIGNRGGLYKPDMFAKGIVHIKPKINKKGTSKSLSVPKTAVLWTGEVSVVYVRVPATKIPTFEYREVSLGAELEDGYLVESGLEVGEEVVTNGAFRVDASAQLNNKASMMNRHILVKGDEQKEPDYQAETPSEFKQQLGQLFKSYLSLKDALVQTDYETSKTAANQLESDFKKVDMSLLQGDAHLYWMKKEEGLKHHIAGLLQATDTEAQRKEFSPVSDLLTQTIRSFGMENQTAYVQHCPMAFDDKGAYWLSESNQVRNPYFGDKMLKCGLVKDSLKFN